ncbi:MAG: hypothetical protein RR387_03565 [Clostridiales bacterium]
MDWTSIIVGVLACLGTFGGSLAGVRASNRLVNHRISELEKKMDKHNGLIEKVYGLEAKTEVFEEQIKVANHRLGDLEKGA